MRTGKPVASIDLIAITDRFPIRIQLIVLEETLCTLGFKRELVVGLCASLETLLGSARQFRIHRKTMDPQPALIRYAVGQPMGTNLSIPLAAFSHHILVRLAAYRCGVNPYKIDTYRILGDDQVLSGEQVSKEYLSLIATLGMDYSKGKSIGLSGLGHLSEIAKRLLFRSNIGPLEITPLSPGVLTNSIYHTVIDLLRKSIGDTIKLDTLIRGWCTLHGKSEYHDIMIAMLSHMRLILSIPLLSDVQGLHPRQTLKRIWSRSLSEKYVHVCESILSVYQSRYEKLVDKTYNYNYND
jgi:hypothetical protein